jgi:hypothetical protein
MPARDPDPAAHRLWALRPVVLGTSGLYLALSFAFCWAFFKQPFANGAGDWDQHTLYYAAVMRNAAFGALPFWNPWYCGGNVLWANPQVSLVSPIYALALAMPLTLAMKLNVVVHYFVGFIGMHLVVRRLVGVRSLAVTVYVASLFVFSGALALHVEAGHTNLLPVFALPLVVYSFWGAAAGRRHHLLLGAAVVGIAILNGGVHVAPLAAVLLGTLGLGAAATARALRPLALAVVIMVLGVACAAPRVVPAWFFIHSTSFRDVRPERERDRMSLEMLRVAFWSAGQDPHPKVSPGVQLYGWHEYGNYMGWFGATASVLAAGWILAARRRREHWREVSIAGAFVAAALLAAGDFAPGAPASVLRELPFFENFRIPSRFTMLVPLAGALCVAFAARALEAAWGASRWRRLAEIGCVVAAGQIGIVNHAHLREVFVVPAETQSRLFDRITPTVVESEIVSPGPRVHRTFMLDTMLAGASARNCYEQLQVRTRALPGPAQLTATGATLSDQTFSPNRVTAHADVGGDAARVVLNQNFADGWSSEAGPVEPDPATGRPSVVLPAGYTGRIAFTFVPPGLGIGLVLWLLALTTSGVVLAFRESWGHDGHIGLKGYNGL